MVFSNRFVACVLVDGQPQRELANGIVPIPLNTNYVLRFRNKHDRPAVVRFTVDGENVSGGGYVIEPNSFVDIRRHADKDVGFRFVGVDSPEAVDHGKNGPDDGTKGVIEAKFYLEKVHQYVPTAAYTSSPWIKPGSYPKWGLTGSPQQDMRGGERLLRAANLAAPRAKAAPPEQELTTGVTVEGDATGQQFRRTHVDLESDYVAIRIVLRGIEQPVEQVRTGRYCTECGHKCRSGDRFCGGCGVGI